MDGHTYSLPLLLWIDLRRKHTSSTLDADYSDICHIHHLERLANICKTIQRLTPQLVCFDYDFPDWQGLQSLGDTRRFYPSLPILMLTEQHSESLAVWAFRSGVWDYLVKPLNRNDLRSYINRIRDIRTGIGNRPYPRPLYPPLLTEQYFEQPSLTAPAITYIASHYHEKITLEQLAALCKTNTFKFSRAFRHDHGQTFREFLLRYRVQKAQELLNHPDASVTEVAFCVGFNDLSQFARIFQRYVGVLPSEYRIRNRSN